MPISVINNGTIKNLALPDKWQENTRRGDFKIRLGTVSDTTDKRSDEPPAPAPGQGFALREFSPDGIDADVRLCFYYRGHPVSDVSGKAFIKTLAKKPHKLTKKEITDLTEVLGDITYPEFFSMQSIRTEDLNGRRILVAEGRWQHQQWDTYSLFTSCDETGTIVQQVYFLAPVQQYASLIEKVRHCFDTIEWSD